MIQSNPQLLADLFLLPESIYHWDTLPLFGNFQDIDPERGIVQPYFYDIKRMNNQCHDNCKALYEPKNCTLYCQKLVEFYQESLDFARRECPSGTKECCKRVAPQNDYAYLACIHSYSKDNETEMNEGDMVINVLYICLIVFLFFLLICCIIKWTKKT